MRFFKVFETSGQETEYIEEFKDDFKSLLIEARERYEERYGSEILAASLVGKVGLWDGERTGGLIVDSERTVLDAIVESEVDDFTVLIDLDVKNQFVFWLHHHDGTHEFRTEWLNERKLKNFAPTFHKEGQSVFEEIKALAVETRPFVRFEKWMYDHISVYFTEDFHQATDDWKNLERKKRLEYLAALREEQKEEIEEARKQEEERVDFEDGINDKFRHIPISKVKAYSTFRNFGSKAEERGVISFRETAGFLTQCQTKDGKTYDFLITRYRESDKEPWLWKAEDPVVFSLIRKVKYFSFVEAYLGTKRIISDVEYAKLLNARDKSKALVNSLVGEEVTFPTIKFIKELNEEERSKFIQNDAYLSNLLEGDLK